MTLVTWSLQGRRTPLSASDMVSGLIRASTQRAVGALAIDIFVVVGIAALVGAGAMWLELRTAVVYVVAGLVGVVGAVLVLRRRSQAGRGVGGHLLAVRAVGPGGFPPRWPWQATTYDTRRGPDPLAVSGRSLPGYDQLAHADAARDTAVDRLQLVADDGSRFEIFPSLLVGRTPRDQVKPAQRVAFVTDFSRTMSRSHALLECQPAAIYVTDLGSRNGSKIQRDSGATVPLARGVATPLDRDDTLFLGERTFTLQLPSHQRGDR